MIFSQMNGIIGCIEKAIEINQQMLVQSKNTTAMDKAAILSEIINDLQVQIVSIHGQYMSLLNQKIMLEKKLAGLEGCST